MMGKLKFKGKATGSSNASPYGLKDEALKNAIDAAKGKLKKKAINYNICSTKGEYSDKTETHSIEVSIEVMK